MKPIFAYLSSDTLLAGCLHGKTQNQNESFNGVWDRIPKSKLYTLPLLQFGVYDAVFNFNIGRNASVLTFEKMGMMPGYYMLRGCSMLNKRRLYMILSIKTRALLKNVEKLSAKRKNKKKIMMRRERGNCMKLEGSKSLFLCFLILILSILYIVQVCISKFSFFIW